MTAFAGHPNFADHTILWDLDGTITDPKVGITKGVQHALHTLGIEVDDSDSLTGYIGPPLHEGFVTHHAIQHHQIDDAVAAYREYYLEHGIYEAVMIPGIEPLLQELADSGRRMAIATSKVDWMAEQILDHYELRDHFEFVGGATMDGSRNSKADVIEHVLKQLELDTPDERENVVIVGDREHDVIGARVTGIASVGVRWGYAEPGELEAAGPDAIVDNVADLSRALLTQVPPSDEPPVRRKLGQLKGRIWVGPDFDEADVDILRLFNGDDAGS